MKPRGRTAYQPPSQPEVETGSFDRATDDPAPSSPTGFAPSVGRSTIGVAAFTAQIFGPSAGGTGTLANASSLGSAWASGPAPPFDLQPVPAISSPPRSAAPGPKRERKNARVPGFIDRRMPEPAASGQLRGDRSGAGIAGVAPSEHHSSLAPRAESVDNERRTDGYRRLPRRCPPHPCSHLLRT